MIQPVYNNLLVSVESELVETIKRGTLELKLADHDLLEGRLYNTQKVGTVVATPRAMYKESTVVPEVKVGDKVFLHYNAIEEETRYELPDGTTVYLVPYEYIFVVLNDDTGNPEKMIGGRVLCEPVYDDDLEFDNELGHVRRSASGIILETNVKHNVKVARVSCIGTPLTGNRSLPVLPGDLIVYPENADFENVINDRTYFCMTQEDLLLVIDEKK
jgi:co-chaperonin GroES (HSP10)